MRLFCLIAAMLWTITSLATAADPCTNGSFEELNAAGFAVDWQPIGVGVNVVDNDAHSGKRAVRLVRTLQDETPETGFNRDYRHGSGEGGAMIARRQGGIDFWYKAVSAEDAELCIYAIPMNSQGIEQTAAQRSKFAVQEDHVGDGQWHHGRLKYDYADNPDVQWIQFAARIVGRAGEILLDDLAFIEETGPILRVTSIRLEEDESAAGGRCVVQAKIENTGDKDTGDVLATLRVPAGLKAEPAKTSIDLLGPGDSTRAKWTVIGERAANQVLTVVASAAKQEASASITLQTGLVIRSFGPETPVAAVDHPTLIQCVLENTGQVPLKNPKCEFTFSSATGQQTLASIPPGGKRLFQANFLPQQQSQRVKASVRVTADGVDEPLQAESALAVGSSLEIPNTEGRLRVAAEDDYAVLANRFVRLAFRKNAFGFGAGELSVSTGDNWKTVAWLPRLGRVVCDADGDARNDYEIFTETPPQVAANAVSELLFHWTRKDDKGRQWDFAATFSLAGWSKEIHAKYELKCDQSAKLLAFEGPMLYVLQRNEAIFPGLEWLVDDEVSSSSLDIAENHPHRIRYVVHPNMVTIPAIGMHSKDAAVGMYWDLHQRWDGQRDRPSAVFASPDRFENQRSHLVGLFLPTVPDFVEANQRVAANPYPLQAKQTLTLEATLFADATADDALAAVERWIDAYGIPEPSPLPHETYEREIEFSMQAYLTSLWEPKSRQWWLTKGNAVMSTTGRPRSYVADLMTAALVTDDASLRRRCLERAGDVRALLGGDARLDAQRFPDRADLAYANPDQASQLLASLGEGDVWRFDADQTHQEGPFVGRDYYDLGPDGALEVGTCARNAYQVLRYARISGDWEAYDGVQKSLAAMETFRVPRAAQVWEIPVHTPDLLAAADAVDAFVEAHRFSGQQRWLRDAVLWAKRGLPFIYLWDDPQKPYLRGASIPVYGATWYQGSWFGRPVQWNGLRYAVALLRLSEYDDSYPWRQIAQGIIHSAIHQQEQRGENVALWPDAISAIDGEKSAWIFGPHQILDAVFRLVGRNPEPTTTIVNRGRQQLHVTTVGTIVEAPHRGQVWSVDVSYPEGEQGIVLMSNVTRPTVVYLDGNPILERIDIEQWEDPSWRYDAGNAYLAVRVTKDGPSRVRADGVVYREVRRLPWLAEEIAFDFDQALDGWLPAHHMSELVPVNGSLSGRLTGPDPYLVRRLVRVNGSDCPVLNLRMRVTAGSGGQLYWSTQSSPGFDDDRSIRFQIVPDGRFHDYRLELGQDPMWAGQVITGLRLDPCSGAQSGEFNIDSLRTSSPDR